LAHFNSGERVLGKILRLKKREQRAGNGTPFYPPQQKSNFWGGKVRRENMKKRTYCHNKRKG